MSSEERKVGNPLWDFPSQEVLEPIKPFVKRIAALSVPLVNAPGPMFAAVLPMGAEDGPWLGKYLQDLAADGAAVENYIAHGPTLSALERITGFRFPPVAEERRKYTAEHRDLQVSLRIKQRIEEGKGLTPEEIDALIREGKVALTVIYYY